MGGAVRLVRLWEAVKIRQETGMDINQFYFDENEKPLDKLVSDGGFCGILRNIGCIGDSLSSGEFESLDEDGNRGYHDRYEYSWGQFLARSAGVNVYNYSRGGMSAKWFCDSFGVECGCFDPSNAHEAYIIALGVNDLNMINADKLEFGSMNDVDFDNYENNKPTFVGYYTRIIQKIREMQPKCRIFLMTIPSANADRNLGENGKMHRDFLYSLAEKFEYTYILDFRQYAPVYDEEFKKHFYLGGHLNAAGYLLTARMVESYIDYIIRKHHEDFCQVGFVGTGYYNKDHKW